MKKKKHCEGNLISPKKDLQREVVFLRTNRSTDVFFITVQELKRNALQLSI